MKKAFTLAEVLITLGIIGIVAAMTIPTLISKYRKSTVETRLKRASALLTNAARFVNVDYGFGKRDMLNANDPDNALEIFNKYYTPYIKFNKVRKTQLGVIGYLNDGSAMYFRRPTICGTDPRDWGCTYMYYCIDAKSCDEIDESNTSWSAAFKIADGVNVFTMYTSGTAPTSDLRQGIPDEELVENCKNQIGMEPCTALIYKNGWKIPDNYPHKF